MTKIQLILVLLLTVVHLHLVHSSNQYWEKKDFFRQLLKGLVDDNDDGVNGPLMKKYVLKHKYSIEMSHKQRIRRSKAQTVGNVFYWLTTGGSIVASGGMAVAYINLGFDNFFNTNTHCCGYSCCTKLCTDKAMFDEMKNQLFGTTKSIDAEWVEVEKAKNYIDNLNRLINELKTEVTVYDKNLMNLITTATDETEQQILDAVNIQVAKIKQLGTYTLTEKQLEDNYLNSIFQPMESNAQQLGDISSDIKLVCDAVKQLKENTIEQVHTAFSTAQSGDYDRITITSLSPYGYSANLVFTTEMAVIETFFNTIWVEIPAQIFNDGWNVITVFSTVQDVFYKTQQLNKCTDLNNALQEAITLIQPELVKVASLYNNTVKARNEIEKVYNLDPSVTYLFDLRISFYTQIEKASDAGIEIEKIYDTLRNGLKATTLSTYNDQAMNVLASSTFQSAYVSSFNALQDFNTKIQTTITRDELELDLLPNLIKSFTQLSNKYACVDQKISYLKSTITLCKNQNTMYTTDDVSSIAIANQKLALEQSECTDTSISTNQELKTYLQYMSKDGSFNSDCLLNSLLAYHSVCNEWRNYLTNDEIMMSLHTSSLAPLTSVTSSQVDDFVTRGCTPNDVLDDTRAVICYKKSLDLSRDNMHTLFSRHNIDQLNSAYDTCLLSQQQYLIDAICNLKATQKKSVSYIESITPYIHYTTSDVQQQYDACALNADQKSLVCFYNKEIGLTVDEIMTENEIPYYPKSVLESAYNDCDNKVVTDTDKRRICQFKMRYCSPDLCAFDNEEFETYKSTYGVDLVKQAYDSC